MTPLRVSVSIISTSPDIIARAAETLTRAATGLALEGVEVMLIIDADISEDADADTDG